MQTSIFTGRFKPAETPVKTNEYRMTLPKTNTQEVLYTLINQGHVSIMDYPYMSGFRTRVSELARKHGLYLKQVNVVSYNKFGNQFTYVVHRMGDRDKAIQIYQEITKTGYETK